MAVSHVFNNTIADATGTVTAWNGATTVSVAATALVRPSDWNSAHNMRYNITGNTTNASSVSGTDILFNATGNISIGGSASSLLFSVAPQSTQAASFTLTGNTTQNSTFTAAGAVTLRGAGGVSVGASNGSVVVSTPVPGVMSYLEYPPVLNNTGTMSVGGGSSIYVQPVMIQEDLSASFLRMPVSMSPASTTFATGAAAYGSSVAQSNSMWVNFYSMGVGASSRSLQYVAQASTTWALQISYSGSASTHSVSYNFTVPGSGGVATNFQLTSSQQSSAVNEVPAGTSDYASYRLFDMPFATSLSAGNYFIGVQRSSTTGGGSNIGLGISAMIVTQHNSSMGFPGFASNSSILPFPFLGLWSTNTVGTTTSSMGAISMSTLASHPRMYFQLHRSA